jgi:hypothetical protein
VIALDEELGGPATIDAVSWQWASGGTFAAFGDLEIVLGHYDQDALGAVFDDNYLPGSDVMVYSEPYTELKVGADDWVTLDLETAFDYDGTDNLVMEVRWSSGSGSIYTYKWETGQDRCLRGDGPGSAHGTLLTQMCEFRIETSLALEQSTFGSIKAYLGSM